MRFYNKACYFLVKWFFFIVLKIYNRLTVRMLAPLPEENFILIANHCSHLDPLVIGAAIPGRLRFLAKAELFEPLFLGTILRLIGVVPVHKQDSQSAGTTLRAFLKILEEGENVVIFPEGGRSQDGKLQPLEGGAALIALKSGAPVVPAFAAGTFEAMPVGVKKVKPGRLSVVIGKPIDTNEYINLGKKGREQLLGRMSRELASLELPARALIR
jgi:1-acyl-sn-glycerol-3-phosphate acyltransferase